MILYRETCEVNPPPPLKVYTILEHSHKINPIEMPLWAIFFFSNALISQFDR